MQHWNQPHRIEVTGRYDPVETIGGQQLNFKRIFKSINLLWILFGSVRIWKHVEGLGVYILWLDILVHLC